MAGVGEASAIFGLITGSLELIKLSIEICKAAQGEVPSRIRAVTEQLPSIVQLLEDAHGNATTKAKTSPNDSVWNKVKPDLERCEKECVALYTLFEKACPKNDSSSAQRMWKTSVAILRGKRSEAEEHLATILKTLSVLEIHHVITNTRLLEGVKKTLEDLDESDSGNVHKGTGDINTYTGSGTFNHVRIQDNGRNIQLTGHYNEHQHYYQNDNAASREERTIEELLAWLNYAGMNQRCEEVERAHKSTFKWIFDCSRNDGCDVTGSHHQLISDSAQPKNTGFVPWLREETGIFWIYGKPGAGKSTLMKYITGDPRLKEHASVWAGSHQLSVSSFYFWKLGSKIQKSLGGLYRALLWQILKDDRKLARKAFPDWQTNFGAVELPVSAFKAALHRLIKECVLRKKYLILIDGLDEYEDDERDSSIGQEMLSQDLLQMVESGSVKIIIASRPERAFESNFSHGRKLAVHDLTARDIERFARDRLINDRTIRPSSEHLTAREHAQLHRFVKAVVRKSQGVFLWTRIVVELARIHIRDYQDVDELGVIMTKLPPDLEKLFDQIMDRIVRLGKLKKVKSLRYLAITSHWFATTARYNSQYAQWLPLSVLGIGCELRNQNVTESWLEENTQRLTNIGRDESGISGRVKSYCFGLLETSNGEADDLASQPSPVRKGIRPLHRTLVEYLSRHPTMQNAQNLLLPDHESFDANIAILVGLIVVYDYALVSSQFQPVIRLFQSVVLFNKLAEESTGSAQITILSAFDRTMKAGFKTLVKRFCRLDHDHEASCIPDILNYLDLSGKDRRDVYAFEQVVQTFALNPSHPLISKTHRPEGFLDLLAITIAANSNALLKHRMDDAASGGYPLAAIINAEYATRLLHFALNKNHVQQKISFAIDFKLDQPNIEASRLLLQRGGSPEVRFNGVSTWERFLDDMLRQSIGYARSRAESPTMVTHGFHRSLWGLDALRYLISHGARQDVYRTWSAMLEEGFPSKRRVVEFRRYSVVQITNMLLCESELDPERYTSEISEIKKMRHRLEQQNHNSIPGQRCSWSDLEMAGHDFVKWKPRVWRKWARALMIARRTGRDIAKYQQFQVGTRPPGNEGVILTWLPHGCREMSDLPNDLVEMGGMSKCRPKLPRDGQRAEFDVAGWLIYEADQSDV